MLTSLSAISARLSALTVWDTVDQLKADIARGRKPPSFCTGKPASRQLADDLETMGVPVLRYT